MYSHAYTFATYSESRLSGMVLRILESSKISAIFGAALLGSAVAIKAIDNKTSAMVEVPMTGEDIEEAKAELAELRVLLEDLKKE